MEKISRSFLKAVTWRVSATLITGLLVYFVSGDYAIAISVGILDLFIKIIVYVLHERGWANIKWGIKS